MMQLQPTIGNTSLLLRSNQALPEGIPFGQADGVSVARRLFKKAIGGGLVR
jgi:hypothetical protein